MHSSKPDWSGRDAAMKGGEHGKVIIPGKPNRAGCLV